MKVKKFLMDGVGHNDVNIQFIGLRIFMQYQEELQSSNTSSVNIDCMTTYLENPPHFDMLTNKIQNFGDSVLRKQIVNNRKNDENGLRMVNSWNAKKRQFDKFQRYLPTKMYDLAQKLKCDAQKKQNDQVKTVMNSGWI